MSLNVSRCIVSFFLARRDVRMKRKLGSSRKRERKKERERRKGEKTKERTGAEEAQMQTNRAVIGSIHAVDVCGPFVIH